MPEKPFTDNERELISIIDPHVFNRLCQLEALFTEGFNQRVRMVLEGDPAWNQARIARHTESELSISTVVQAISEDEIEGH